MGIDLADLRATTLSAGLDAESAAQVRHLILSAWAPRTQLAYQSSWRIIEETCARLAIPTMPMSAQMVAAVLARLAFQGYAKGVLSRFRTVISQAHQLSGHPDYTRDKAVRMVLDGAARKFRRKPHRKSPILVAHLLPMVAVAKADPNRRRGVRDVAIIFVGFGGALRGDEIVNANVEHLAFDDKKLVVTIPTSKSDQLGDGHQVEIHRGSSDACPVAAVERWIRLLPEPRGPLFRKVSRFGRIGPHRLTHRTIPRIVKDYVMALDLDPAQYGGHSMRAGFITAALRDDGVRDIDVMRVARHRHFESTLGYFRPQDEINITERLGL